MLTTKLARKARSVGQELDDARAAEALAAWPALVQRAGEREPRADDPLAGDGAETRAAVGEILFAVATVAQRLGVSTDHCVINLDRYGNTSAACLPIALHETSMAGNLKQGDKIKDMIIAKQPAATKK